MPVNFLIVGAEQLTWAQANLRAQDVALARIGHPEYLDGLESLRYLHITDPDDLAAAMVIVADDGLTGLSLHLESPFTVAEAIAAEATAYAATQAAGVQLLFGPSHTMFETNY